MTSPVICGEQPATNMEPFLEPCHLAPGHMGKHLHRMKDSPALGFVPLRPSYKYRRKPESVEAMQWTGTNLEECAKFFGPMQVELSCDDYQRIGQGNTSMTLMDKGRPICAAGCWLVRGPAGFFILSDEEFRLKYEREPLPFEPEDMVEF